MQNKSIILKNIYIKFLEERYTFKAIEHDTLNVVEIITPFVNNINDLIVLYAVSTSKDSKKVILTDDGYTLSELESSGFNVSPHLDLIKKRCENFGAMLSENEIIVKTSQENLSSSIHKIIQSIIHVDNLQLIK